MKAMLIAVAGAVALLGVGVASAQEDIAKADGCLNCHAVDTKKVGPAFKDIAAKYKGDAGAEAKLTAKITQGSGHPKTKASPEDATKVVKWILGM
ncbi:MAG TPA: c-type cytochrome [Casimicrobiaceae bacterium]|nr:c-type cytochrome [Casimicrobiaceae bacterium]